LAVRDSAAALQAQLALPALASLARDVAAARLALGDLRRARAAAEAAERETRAQITAIRETFPEERTARQRARVRELCRKIRRMRTQNAELDEEVLRLELDAGGRWLSPEQKIKCDHAEVCADTVVGRRHGFYAACEDLVALKSGHLRDVELAREVGKEGEIKIVEPTEPRNAGRTFNWLDHEEDFDDVGGEDGT
jgi:hypothetical protein